MGSESVAQQLKELVEYSLVPRVEELTGKVENFASGIVNVSKALDTVHHVVSESLNRERALEERLSTVESTLKSIPETVRIEVDKKFAAKTP